MKIRTSIMNLPMVRPFRIARGTLTESSTVLVEVEANGITGYGEAAPIARYDVSVEGVMAFYRDYEPPADDPYRVEALLEGIPEAARCGLDIALYDWIGKDLGKPVWQLLGLDPAAAGVTSHTVGIEDRIEDTVDRVRKLSALPVLKIKLGAGKEIETIEAIRSVYRGAIRLDANEGWDPEQTVRLLRELHRYEIELCEQPIPSGHPEQLRYIRERVKIPLVADEDSIVAADLPALIGCVDGVNLKLAKAGGIRAGLAFIHTARALGFKLMLGCMLETEVLASAAAQLAPLVDWPDIDGPLFLASSPFDGVDVSTGKIVLTGKPGIGVKERARV
ncbi:MAG TPA: dipeptide epimerase [Candidatus Baltobacteraceae bacterium]|nr:dipeptide epimerase [Candidatus Baltobacteraceae bacterium]